MKLRLNPLTVKKLRRFYRIKRGFYSFAALGGLFLLSLAGELLVNNRALVVSYRGALYFPTYGDYHPRSDFGLEGNEEVDYRELKAHLEKEGQGDWLLMPPVPYNAVEQDFIEGSFPPHAPSRARQHYLGTDRIGRDILARLFYGFRIAMVCAFVFLAAVYLIGIALGCAMGYFGGKVDLIGLRLVEIWANIPFLYMVIIAVSLIPAGFPMGIRIGVLLFILVIFSWTAMAYYMRASTYKEKARDYAAAALVLGASTPRVIFRHVMPNTISTIVTFIPFTVASAIISITALDFLGFGLPPPTPSIGELLKQGTDNLRTAPWIVTSAFSAMVFILTLVTFIGEAVREAFDPKQFTTFH